MAVSSCEEVQDQEAYSISVLTENEIVNPQYLTCLNFQETQQRSKNAACEGPQWDCKNCTILQIHSLDTFSPCSVDMDIKNGRLQTPNTDERSIGGLIRSDSSLSRASRRKISLQIGEKLMQLLLNHNVMLLKETAGDKSDVEIASDTHNSRWRRYKRGVSFDDSRRVALIFSILSIFGTLVLIYLTLRVGRIDNGITLV